MPKKKRTRKKPYGVGFALDFHGAFSKKAPALARARKVKGFEFSRKARVGMRYIVATLGGNPF